jgi:predicted MFS family arabinose efflux permease
MAFAVFYLPLIAEFGGSRAEVATIQAAVLLLGGAAGPLVGYAFDRLGARRLIQCGAALAAAGFIAASRAQSLPAVVVSYGVVGGLGLAALGSQINMLIAALWYPTARGRAIAIADLGTGFGAFCFIPLGQALVGSWGWRPTLWLWAGFLLGGVVPLNALQRVPDAARGPSRSGERTDDWTLARALRAPAFWWLAAMRFSSACAFPLINTHLVAYSVGQGIGAEGAATALGSVSLVSLAGRLTTGWLADRLGRAPALSVMYTSAVAGIGCLALLDATGSAYWLAGFVILYGMSQGSSGIVASARAADVFAGAAFGTIYGALSLAIGPGEALGAWVGGVIYDRTGSYLPAFGFVTAALAAALVAVWKIRPNPAGSLR